MDPGLTREELAAVVAGSGGLYDGPAAEPVDLAGGDRLLRALLPAFDRFGKALADRLRVTMTSQLKADVRVLVAPAEIAAAGSWPRHEGYAAVASLRIGDMAPGGLLSLDPALTAMLISRAFGGRRSSEAPPARPLSSVERRVLVPIVESIVADTGQAFAMIAPLPLALLRVEPEDAAQDPGHWGGVGIVVAATLQSTETIGKMSLVLPSGALEPLRVHLGRQAGGSGASRDGALRIGRLVREATVEMAAIIGGARLTLAQLVALRPGDVIHLDVAVGDPVAVHVEGIAKFRGRPVLSRGCLAVELAGRMEEAR